MARDPLVTAAAGAWPLSNPWPASLLGLLTNLLALAVHRTLGEPMHGWLPALVAFGLLAGGFAVSVYFQSQPLPDRRRFPLLLLLLGLGFLSLVWLLVVDLPHLPRGTRLVLGGFSMAWVAAGGVALHQRLWDRPASCNLEATVVLAAAGLTLLLGSSALPAAWDSVQLLLQVAAAVTLAVLIVLRLPQGLRRFAFSLLVLFHFGGILAAVSSVPPNPWISNQLWTRVYRPYLEFMYLNNAYHFYSPDPGPASLVWFRVQYEDGTYRWLKVPNREDFPLAINYQRRLSLTESLNQLAPPLPLSPQQIHYRTVEVANQTGIPPHPEMAMHLQYREPSWFSRRMLETYARHVMRTLPHEHDPSIKPTSVKIYRIMHNIPTPRDIQVNRGRLDDETSYIAFYQGEYDKDGRLLDPNDKLLWWVIPIIRVPKSNVLPPGFGTPEYKPNPDDFEIKDFVRIHAGDVRPSRTPPLPDVPGPQS